MTALLLAVVALDEIDFTSALVYWTATFVQFGHHWAVSLYYSPFADKLYTSTCIRPYIVQSVCSLTFLYIRRYTYSEYYTVLLNQGWYQISIIINCLNVTSLYLTRNEPNSVIFQLFSSNRSSAFHSNLKNWLQFLPEIRSFAWVNPSGIYPCTRSGQPTEQIDINLFKYFTLLYLWSFAGRLYVHVCGESTREYNFLLRREADCNPRPRLCLIIVLAENQPIPPRHIAIRRVSVVNFTSWSHLSLYLNCISRFVSSR